MIEGRAKIVLTRRWPGSVEARLSEFGEVVLNADDTPFSTEQLRRALCEADVICPTVTDNFSADVFAGLDTRTGLLANFGVGFNHIDIEAANEASIQITNTPGVLTEATAELALTLLLMSARRTGAGERHVRARAWAGWCPTHMLSTQVTGKILGIVGMGRIGTSFARKAHHGLGMQILYNNPQRVAESLELELGAEAVSLDNLLGLSDFVSLHCPAAPATRHLLDAQRLALMQPRAHLINTARGDIVDEVALVQALGAGILAGAGLDVYAQEPQLAEGLLNMEQVVLLPHMGSGTVETRQAMGMRALANVEAFLNGRPMPDLVVSGNSA